jgi:hypothetical protein
MVKIKLTQGHHALVDEKDSLWIDKWNWCYGSGGYAIRDEKGKRVLMHQEILIHRMKLIIPLGMTCNHKDRNKLNNQRYNLRVATRSMSNFNRNMQSNNISGFRGVHWNKQRQKWQVSIKVNYKQIHLGLFKNLQDAINVRRKAEIRYFGENPDD